MSDMPHPVHDRPPVERVDPRDFLDPTARAVAYLDLDDPDGARRCLSEVSLHRLRQLGQHYDRLSMICFELASPAEHVADVTEQAAERGLDRLREAYRHAADLADVPAAAPSAPSAPSAPFLVSFEDPTEGEQP